MSRVDSVKIGAMRAQLPLEGSVLASDAFFPFRDGIDEAAKHRITAIIQPAVQSVMKRQLPRPTKTTWRWFSLGPPLQH